MMQIFAKLALHRWQLALLILMPIIAHIASLTGLVQCDPETAYSQMTTITKPALMQGAGCFVDPGVGAITQPLGYLSAQDWLHGIVPWWNPYNGVGMPLAAEMQPESFFLPIVLLLHFHSGWLMQLLIFQIAAGLLTYAFLCELGISTGAALLGGAVFSLNGTFFLTPGAVSAPIMFLPMLMLGIEHATKAATQGRKGGWSLIVLAVAGSIYAGFPMVAYFDGLLAGGWSLLRLYQGASGQRRILFGKLCLGCGIGVALTAPLLNAFLQELQIGFLGIQVISGQLKLPVMAAPLQIFPLFYGALASYPPFGLDDHGLWIRIGGWFGCTALLLALYGLFGHHRQRAGKYLLAAWIIAFQARYFGAPGFIALFNVIPGISLGDVVRFSTPASEFAIASLAALGYSDLQRRDTLSLGKVAMILGAFSACVGLAIFPVRNIVPVWFTGYPNLIILAGIFMAITACSCLAMSAIFISLRFIPIAQVLTISGALSVALLSEAGAARSKTYDPSVLNYLKSMSATSRLYTLGPIMPNLSARQEIASINYISNPVPNIWTDFIRSSLFPSADLSTFTGNQPGQAAALRRHLSAYQKIGVTYILTVSGQNPFNATFLPRTADQSMPYQGFNASDQVKVVLTNLSLPFSTIDAVAIRVGTFFGRARGALNIKLCTGSDCASGSADLAAAADNQPLRISLNKSIRLPSHSTTLSYTLSHPDGTPVAITFAVEPDATLIQSSIPSVTQHFVPRLILVQTAATQPALIFRNQSVDLYALQNSAPYMQISNSSCTLTVIDRQHAISDCPRPSHLIRRELFFPGWRVSVNESKQPIQLAEEIFQDIALPTGRAAINFTYMPLHTRAACAVALSALLLWLGCAYQTIRKN